MCNCYKNDKISINKMMKEILRFNQTKMEDYFGDYICYSCDFCDFFLVEPEVYLYTRICCFCNKEICKKCDTERHIIEDFLYNNCICYNLLDRHLCIECGSKLFCPECGVDNKCISCSNQYPVDYCGIQNMFK